MRFHPRRSLVAALAVAVSLTTFNLAPAQAAARKVSGPELTPATDTTTDFSARRRHYRRGNAAALGAVVGVFGAIAAIAAANQYRDGYYYGDPYYYGPGPYYYGGGPYYSGGYYGGGHYRGGHAFGGGRHGGHGRHRR